MRSLRKGKGVKQWDEALTGPIYLGNEAFVKRMQARTGNKPSREIPRAQYRRTAQALPSYLRNAERDEAIFQAYRDGGHTQTAIADAAGLLVSRVSRVIAKREAKGETCPVVEAVDSKSHV